MSLDPRLMPTYAPAPVTFVRGLGSRLFDTEGRSYLDFISGLAVTSLGHSHPGVAAALARQANTLLAVSNLYSSAVGPEVAGTLDRLLGGGGQVFFANSGAEANECAIKLSRRWARAKGRGHVVVSARMSFHGRTMGALAATGQPAKQEAFAPMLPGFRYIDVGDSAGLAEALAPGDVAAVMLETILAEGGVMEVDSAWLLEVADRVRSAGALLVIDEVQTGLGRTGRWFGFEHSGIRPDVVTLAKALGNGVPVGACWARRDVAGAFGPGDHGTTLGGQPLAMAAAGAVLAIMEAEEVPARAARTGARLERGLKSLPGVSQVRGRGLLLAFELASQPSREVAAEALANGLLVNAVTPSAIRLAPSLLVDDNEVDEALELIAKVVRP
ncbi:MAG: aspartate aminotransferase family protein [Acidimicrobiales bacterium]